ncbi:MAG: 4-(cytidine 5'-diphospho)-2-C-methyl-D-erythritol kinase [Elusimicrobia bacterium]|nr:4-(cytidine 5'-diphospho)-2-C-methyl-D-erythritol kinase [Elusimicrobiota bacterium]
MPSSRTGAAAPRAFPAPAKINLFLEIFRRRSDGYHTLSTLFQEISLADTLRARPDPSGGPRLFCSFPGLTATDDNLVVRAARAFAAEDPKAVPLRFDLAKKIPLGAGLGGGSSDAAAALKAQWFFTRGDRPFPEKRFRLPARRLGADVPFFLRGGLAEGRGVGEKLEFLMPRRPAVRHFVLVYPRVFSSTPDAYRALRFPLTKRRSGLKLKRALIDGAPARLWAPELFNRLEEAVLPRLPAVAKARRALEQSGCLAARMSGSGSSVFGVVETPAQGRAVLRRLSREPWDLWLVRSADRRAP